MQKLFFSVLILMFLLTACSFGGNTQNAAVAALEATRVAQFAAATVQAEFTAAAASAVPPTAAPTETVSAPPTETATPEPTATPTEIPVVKATTNSNANCRLGPNKVFALVELLNAGTTALVIGQYTGNGQWWKVRTDSGKECWILGDNVSVSGDLSIVAMLESPPTPTPVPPPDWNGTWTIRMARDYVDTTKVTYQVTMVQTGNQLTYSFSLAPYSFIAYLTVSPDGMSATGTLNKSNGDAWILRFYRVPENLNQFRGEWYYKTSMSYDGDNCGYKNGVGFPDPCRP